MVDEESKGGESSSKKHSPIKSKWLIALGKEAIAKKEKEEKEKADRAERMRKILDSDDSEDDLIAAGKGKTLTGDGLFDYLKKIDDHLKAESNLLGAWHEKDL